MRFKFPFRRDNRRPDGFWDVPDATDDNIKGTSVDPYDPVWPRWKQAPPDHGEGEFISESRSSTSTRSVRRRSSIRPAGPLWTATSMAIQRAANELATCPAAISGGGDSSSQVKAKRLTSSGRWPLHSRQHLQHRIL